MTFRIRKPHVNSTTLYNQAQNAYFEHLRKFTPESDSDLFKYFGWDFFHDGSIKSIKFNPNLATVELVLSGCNVETPDGKGGFKFERPIDFICEFSNVARFSVINNEALEAKHTKARRPIYLYSEINTSIPKAISKRQTGLSSLKIQALGDMEYVWIDLLFARLRVEPKDPEEYNRLRSIPNAIFPLYVARA